MINLQKMAQEHQTRMITVGASAYPRIIDFKRMGEIPPKWALVLLADIAHIAGLVAGGLHPSPVRARRFCHHHHPQDPARAARRLILCQEKYAKEIDSQIFPGIQGGR